MPRPTKASLIDSAVTEGGYKVSLGALIDWLEQIIGDVDEFIRVARGTTATRPAATQGGWLRWNTDLFETDLTGKLDIAVANGVWRRVLDFAIDTTWHMRFDIDRRYLALFKSTNSSNIATFRIQNNLDDYVDVERTASATIIKSSGTDKVYFQINGSNVMSIDSAGNLICAGDVTAKSTP